MGGEGRGERREGRGERGRGREGVAQGPAHAKAGSDSKCRLCKQLRNKKTAFLMNKVNFSLTNPQPTHLAYTILLKSLFYFISWTSYGLRDEISNYRPNTVCRC